MGIQVRLGDICNIGGVVFYAVSAIDETGREWTLQKRYTDFAELDAALRHEAGHGLQVPELPRKTLHGAFTGRHCLHHVLLDREAFARGRRDELQRYMDQVCQGLAALSQSRALHRFLEPLLSFSLLADLGGRTETAAEGPEPSQTSSQDSGFFSFVPVARRRSSFSALVGSFPQPPASAQRPGWERRESQAEGYGSFSFLPRERERRLSHTSVKSERRGVTFFYDVVDDGDGDMDNVEGDGSLPVVRRFSSIGQRSRIGSVSSVYFSVGQAPSTRPEELLDDDLLQDEGNDTEAAGRQVLANPQADTGGSRRPGVGDRVRVVVENEGAAYDAMRKGTLGRIGTVVADHVCVQVYQVDFGTGVVLWYKEAWLELADSELVQEGPRPWPAVADDPWAPSAASAAPTSGQQHLQLRRAATSPEGPSPRAAPATAPMAFCGHLKRQTLTYWSRRLYLCRRLVLVKDAKLYWYRKSGHAYDGLLDFTYNKCKVVVDQSHPTRFAVCPIGGRWTSGNFDGAESGRELRLDAAESEHSRELWVEVLSMHIRYGEEQRAARTLALRRIMPCFAAGQCDEMTAAVCCMKQPLRYFFLGDYRRYQEMKAEDTAYEYERTADGTKVLLHRPSGIRVWARALDLCGVGTSPSQQELTFHYAPKVAFQAITDPNRVAAELWASLMNNNANWGEGVYTSGKEPEEFGSQEAVARNNYASQIAKNPEQLGFWMERTAYCIPVLAPSKICYNVRERATPEMPAVGRNIHGDPLGEGRDVWVVRATDDRGCIVNAVANNEKFLEHQVVALQAQVGLDHIDTLSAVDALANCLMMQERFADAEPLLFRALEGRDALLGEEHPDSVTSVVNLTYCLVRLGPSYCPPSTQSLVQRMLSADLRILNTPSARQRAGTSLCGCAKYMEMHGRAAEAEPLYARSLQIFEESLGPQHPETLKMLNKFAAYWEGQGRFEEAESLCRRCLEVKRHLHGQQHPDTLAVVDRLANCLMRQGRFVDAEEYYRWVFDARRQVSGYQDPETFRAAAKLKRVLEEQGGDREAAEVFMLHEDEEAQDEVMDSLASKSFNMLPPKRPPALRRTSTFNC